MLKIIKEGIEDDIRTGGFTSTFLTIIMGCGLLALIIISVLFIISMIVNFLVFNSAH